MKKMLKSRLVVILTLIALTSATINCGYLLYPERKGQKGGDIDVEVLVMDCLWLIVGVVPGVVALAVDFATGCIYEPGMAMNANPGQKIALRMNGPAPARASLKMVLEDAETGEVVNVLASQEFKAGEEAPGYIQANLPQELASGAYEISIQVNDIENAHWPITITQ